jgi:hypothetical protein
MKQSRLLLHRSRHWIASRSLSSGAHSRDPLAGNDGHDLRSFGHARLSKGGCYSVALGG